MRKFLLGLSLCAAFIATAASPKQPAGLQQLQQEEIQQLKNQVQALEKETAIFQQVTASKQEAQDKRIGDLGLWTNQQANYMASISNVTTGVGIGITVIALIAGFLTLNAAKRAKQEANNASRKWFKKNSSELNKEITQLRQEVQKVKVRAEEANREIDQHEAGVADNAKRANIFTARTMQQPITLTETTSQIGPSSEDLQAAKNANQQLKSKPENEFTANDYYVRGLSEYSANRVDSALFNFEKALEAGLGENLSQIEIAKFLFASANSQRQLGHIGKAIDGYDLIEQKYGSDTNPAMREQVAQALLHKGVALGRSGRHEDAIATFELLEQRYSNDLSPVLRKQVAQALINKGAALSKLRHYKEALTIFDFLEQRYSSDDSPALRKLVAQALSQKGIVLAEQGLFKEAIDTFDQLEQRYGSDDNPAMRIPLAQALGNKGAALGRLGFTKDAIEVFDLLVQLYGDDEDQTLRKLTAQAIFNKSTALGKAGLHQDAIATSDLLEQRYSTDLDPAVREQVAKSLFNKSVALWQEDREDDAMEISDLIEQRYSDDTNPVIRQQVAKALFNKGAALMDSGKNKDAISILSIIVQRYGNDSDPETREAVSRATELLGELQGGDEETAIPA